MEIFEGFFGTDNPFHIALDARGHQVPMIQKIESDLHRDYVTDDAFKEPDLLLKVQCTLKEFFFGATKRIKFPRQHASNKTTLAQNETALNDQNITRVTRDIFIKPGMRHGTILRFHGEGNQTDMTQVGDLVIELQQAEGERMTRDGDDLIYYHRISLLEALTSAPIEFGTLDGETMRFSADEVITPQTHKIFYGKGMPIYNDNPLSALVVNKSRGNLHLRFTIEMPTSFRDSQRQQLVEILSQ